MESKSLNREKIKRHFCCCNTKNSFPENIKDALCAWTDVYRAIGYTYNVTYNINKNCEYDLPTKEHRTPYNNNTFKIKYVKKL